jgi:signal transduction histidine kinase
MCRRAPDGVYLFTAPANDTEQIIELSPDDLSAMLTTGHFPSESTFGFQLWETLRASEEPLCSWFKDIHCKGSISGRDIYVRMSGNSHREVDGTLVCSGMVLDITDMRTQERELRGLVDRLARSEAWMRAALDGAQMLGWDLDLLTNSWATTVDIPVFYGVPSGLDYTNPDNALTAVHPEDVPHVLAMRQHAIETGEPMRYEFRGRVPAPDGFPRWFLTRGQVLRDNAGRPTRLVAVTADVTYRKRAEADREALNRQLLETQKWESLGVLAGGVAHDFNNILTVVLGCSGLVRKGLLPVNPAVTYLDQIEQACRKAADLSQQMLAYAGRGQSANSKTDLNQLIRNSAALLGIPAAKAATISFDLKEGIPFITCDQTHVRQVLINLVMNAAEAIGNNVGRISVCTQSVEVPDGSLVGYHLIPSPGSYVRLGVSDTGPGIEPNVLARMFDPFFSTKFAGRGLGLAAVLGIMRACRGAIRVLTDPERGTTIEVLWPVATPGYQLPESTAGVSRKSGKALIVDD